MHTWRFTAWGHHGNFSKNNLTCWCTSKLDYFNTWMKALMRRLLVISILEWRRWWEVISILEWRRWSNSIRQTHAQLRLLNISKLWYLTAVRQGIRSDFLRKSLYSSISQKGVVSQHFKTLLQRFLGGKRLQCGFCCIVHLNVAIMCKSSSSARAVCSSTCACMTQKSTAN